jgi:hypothetical protein
MCYAASHRENYQLLLIAAILIHGLIDHIIILLQCLIAYFFQDQVTKNLNNQLFLY